MQGVLGTAEAKLWHRMYKWSYVKGVVWDLSLKRFV